MFYFILIKHLKFGMIDDLDIGKSIEPVFEKALKCTSL